MNLVKKVLNKFNGLHYRQEYLCLAKESFNQPLNVYLLQHNHIITDITNLHLFVGYCPLIFALPNIALPENIQLVFSNRHLQPNEIFTQKDAIALLKLSRIKQQAAETDTIGYYTGTKGTHKLQAYFYQLVGSVTNRLYNKKPGNVFLKGNLYKQVQIAYAIPRTIALITVSDGNYFNVFPTDLHGQAGAGHYIISLRTGGKACEQVEAAGRLLISDMDCATYKTVYGSGKNHMQPLKPKEQFAFGYQTSESFQWPLPEGTLSYKELTLLDTFTHGVHKILLFKIVYSHQPVTPLTGTLAHIHNTYATWRYKKGMEGNYLLR